MNSFCSVNKRLFVSISLFLPLGMFPLCVKLPICLHSILYPAQFSAGYSGFTTPKKTSPKPNISHLQGVWVYMLKHLRDPLEFWILANTTRFVPPANPVRSVMGWVTWIPHYFQWHEERASMCFPEKWTWEANEISFSHHSVFQPQLLLSANYTFRNKLL